MEEDDKQRLLVASLLEWTKYTPLDPPQYALYISELQILGQLSEQDVLTLFQVYADWHVAD